MLRADSWVEIERGLAEEGLTLRSKGGGFIVTDGKHWVKASEVGRACSRYHLEKRLGRWPDYRARMAVAAMARAVPAVQLEPGVSQPEVSAPAVDPLPPTAQPDTSTPTTSPVLEWNSQARLRSRKPQLGDLGHGIAELLGYPPARQERPVAPSSPITPPRPSIEASIAGELSASHAGLAQQPHDQEEDAPLGEPTAPIEVVQPHAPVEAIQAAESAETLELTAPDEVAAPENSATAPPPTVQPHVLEEAHAPVSSEPPATPVRVVQPAASPDIRAVETPEPERFTLFEFYGTFGVEDRASGEIYFVETRDRAVAEVKFANQMAEHHPHSLSIARLRTLDNAWNHTRGTPRRFDPKDYGTVPRVAGSVPGPIDDQPGAAPARSVGRPEGDAAPSLTEAAEPMQPGRPQPLPQPVVPGEPAVPVRKKVHPPTRGEEYETALVNLTAELKSLFFDAHAVRRAFAEDVCVNGREHALRTLAETPEQYGRLSFIAKRERLPETVRWGGVYATWQEERTRPATRRAAALYRQAAQIEATDRLLRHAKDVADQKAREIASIEKQFKDAETAVGKVQEGAREVYVAPHLAIKEIRECRKTKGLDEVVHTLRHAPERFGELRAEKQMFGSLRTPQTSAARTRAKIFANEVREAYTALANRPDPGELERAREAHREARHAVDAASRAQIQLPSTLPEDCVRQAGDVLRRAARGSIGRAERMADQLATMGGAVKLARTALNLARGPERDQGHETSSTRPAPDWW